MVTQPRRPQRGQSTFKITLPSKSDFKGAVAAFVFDSAGRFQARSDIKDGKLVLPFAEQELALKRVFIAPSTGEPEMQKPTLSGMERVGAFEAQTRVAGKPLDEIAIPGGIVDNWPFCSCWVKGRVIKKDSGRPVCNARVHICEVDPFWRFLQRLPDADIFRLRDDLIVATRTPRIPQPPEPDPGPLMLMKAVPAPRFTKAMAQSSSGAEPTVPTELQIALGSSSASAIRQGLNASAQFVLPYLCLFPRWMYYRWDEICVVQTDALGRFGHGVTYRCNGDKPDLYFWVEYEINGTMETVYHPPVPCATHWNYACGTEVTLSISDQRVPACDDEPDLDDCVVQVLSIGRSVSMKEIVGPGHAGANDEGLTTSAAPFGGKLEPRVWFSRTALFDKNIRYYKWSYRRLTRGDGSPVPVTAPIPLTRAVVRHYAKYTPSSGVAHVPWLAGPKAGTPKPDLIEMKPLEVPDGGLEWTVMDEREDLASAHFETYLLGSGADPCAKALDAAGKYELILELFKADGTRVDWTTEGVQPQVANIDAPFGTATVTAIDAPAYNRVIENGHTVGFRMVVRVDNNCCDARLEPVTGPGLDPQDCGFLEYTGAASVQLHFKAAHPNNFADFTFSVVRGTTTPVTVASVTGPGVTVGTPSVATDTGGHSYTLTAPADYRASFLVSEVLGTCERAAFAEGLYVAARATDGYSRLSYLDRSAMDGFALARPCPNVCGPAAAK